MSLSISLSVSLSLSLAVVFVSFHCLFLHLFPCLLIRLFHCLFLCFPFSVSVSVCVCFAVSHLVFFTIFHCRFLRIRNTHAFISAIVSFSATAHTSLPRSVSLSLYVCLCLFLWLLISMALFCLLHPPYLILPLFAYISFFTFSFACLRVSICIGVIHL